MTDDALARALLYPRAIALVGASGDAAKNTARPQRFLKKHGYKGRVIPINASRSEVLGEKAWPDLASAPKPIDHAFVMVPAESVPAAIAACGEAGVTVATVFSDNFAETGEAGRARQDALVATARLAGVRLLGPNSMGVVNVPAGMPLSTNAVLEVEKLEPGGLSVVSQSGGVLGTLLSRGQARGFGFAKLVSLGNEADLSAGEILEMLAADRETTAILLFLEGIRDAGRLARAARAAYAAGKPVVVYKLGRSEAGRRVAASHSGALAGAAETADAFFRRHGMLRVDMLETMIELPPLVTGRKPPLGRRVGVLTTTGGGAAMVADRLGALGLTLIPPPAALAARLADFGLRAGSGPLIDITMAGTRKGVYGACLAELMKAPDCDAVVAVVGSSAQFFPELAVAPILEAERGDRPLAVFLVPEAARSLALLAEAGIAAFRTPEACADAVRAYFAWSPPAPEPAPALDLAPVRRALARPGRRRLSETEALAAFAALGIPHPPFQIIRDENQMSRIGYPLAAKVLSKDIVHKSDAGGVVLDVGDGAQLADAFRRITGNVRAARPEAEISGVLLARLEKGLAEVLLGFKRDPEVGPVVVLGAGGVLAEALGDFAVRLAPLSLEDARRMVEEVRGLAPIRGFRGLPQGDVAALARAVVAISELARIESPRVLEAEINPLIVKADGVVAVDGLVVLAG